MHVVTVAILLVGVARTMVYVLSKLEVIVMIDCSIPAPDDGLGTAGTNSNVE